MKKGGATFNWVKGRKIRVLYLETDEELSDD